MAAAVAAGLMVLAACGSSTSSGAATPSSAVPSSPVASGSPGIVLGAGKKFYVSIGDSYAAGYQPIPGRKFGHITTAGFAYRVAATGSVAGKRLQLVNFGCAGATTTSVLEATGCPAILLGPGAPSYPTQTQAAAAVSFIKAHRSDIGLVTISISGNDVTKCGLDPNPTACLTQALVTVKANLRTLLTELRAATGSSVPIVGITYPDVLLGGYVSGNAKAKSIVPISVTAFKALINPALKAEYDRASATFVDVTAATGAYIPLTQTTSQRPYGTVPVAVAKVCQLTWYCQLKDIHPHDSGYQLIADLIDRVLPKA